MTQTSNRLIDEFAKLMTDAAGVAQGMRREVETAFRHQAERFLSDMNLVQREEFEAVRDMAARAREDQLSLRTQVAALEARLARLETPSAAEPSDSARPKRRSAGPKAPAAEQDGGA